MLDEILASPNNAELLLVYADKLLEAGDEHGELIALQIRGVDSEREEELREQFEAEIGDGGEFVWSMGFVRKASSWDEMDFSHRAMALVEEVVIDFGSSAPLGQVNVPLMTRLCVDCSYDNEPDALDAIWTKQPQLLALKLGDLDPGFGDVRSLRNLEELEIVGDLDEDEVRELINHDWPRLRRFSIEALDEIVELLEPVLAGRAMTTVTELGIGDPPAEIAGVIANSAIAGRLTAVGLDFDLADEDDQQAFAPHRAFYDRVELFAVDRDWSDPVYSIATLAEGLSEVFGRHDDAIAMLETVLESLDHGEGWVWSSYARRLRAVNRNDEALVAYDKAIDDGYEYEAEREKAQLLTEMWRFEEAREQYKRVLEHTEYEDPDDHYAMAESVYNSGSPTEAKGVIEDALATREDFDLHRLSATIDLFTAPINKLDDAFARIERCFLAERVGTIEIDEDDDEVGNVYGHLLIRTGRAEDAIGFWNERGSVATDTDAAWGLATAHAAAGRDDAWKVLEDYFDADFETNCPVIATRFPFIRGAASVGKRHDWEAHAELPIEPAALIEGIRAFFPDREFHSLDPADYPDVLDDRIVCATLVAIMAAALGHESTKARIDAIRASVLESERPYVPLEIDFRSMICAADARIEAARDAIAELRAILFTPRSPS